MQSIFVVTAVVAVTEFLKRCQAKDGYGAATIAAAAILGVLAGVWGVDGLTVTNGLIAGLAASGIHTVAKQVG